MKEYSSKEYWIGIYILCCVPESVSCGGKECVIVTWIQVSQVEMEKKDVAVLMMLL